MTPTKTASSVQVSITLDFFFHKKPCIINEGVLIICAALPTDGDAGQIPSCKNCKTVDGVPAPTFTPSGVPGNEVSGDPDISNKKHKRAPEAAPLLTTSDVVQVDGQPDEVSLFNFILSMTQDNTENDIDITPTDQQIATWQIDGNPIGATGKWYAFGNTPQTWKMRGLSGCTAIFIVVSLHQRDQSH